MALNERRLEDDPEHQARLRREQMRLEPERNSAIGNSGPLLEDRMPPPDLETSIEQNRITSRMLILLGSFCLIFAGFWLLYAGWDVREGRAFVPTMVIISGIVGLVLVIAGALKLNRQPGLPRQGSDSKKLRRIA